jgi:Ca2+-binding RTX toxin-like protein
MTSAASAALAVTIDTHAPTAPKILTSSHDTGVVGDGITSDDTLVLTGTAEAHSTVKVADGAHQIGTAIANSAGTWTFATEPLTNGGHSFTAKAMDEAGNTSAASAALAMKVDTHAPQVGFTGLVELWNGAVTLKGTAEASSLVTIYDGTKASPLGTVTAGADGTWKLSTTELSNTIHTFKAQAVDSAGNVGSSSGVAVYGTTGNNTLTSGSGNDVLAGHGGSDTFVFAANFGKDTITDFQSSGRAHDVVQFSASTFDSFASVLAHAAQSGQDVVISADPNNSLTLKHTKLSDLHQSDFHFA